MPPRLLLYVEGIAAFFCTSISWSIVQYTSLRFWTNINQYLLKFWPSFTASCTNLCSGKVVYISQTSTKRLACTCTMQIIQNVLSFDALKTENIRGISHYSLFQICGVNFKWSQSVSLVNYQYQWWYNVKEEQLFRKYWWKWGLIKFVDYVSYNMSVRSKLSFRDHPKETKILLTTFNLN